MEQSTRSRVYGRAGDRLVYTKNLESPRTVVAADVKRMFDSASGKVRLWTALVQYHQPLQRITNMGIEEVL